jgi:hypothetical protein
MLPCDPTHDPKAATAPVTHAADDKPPRPIGPERLRALREAILSGAYPTQAAVTSGLLSLFRGAANPPGEPPPPTKPS